MPSPLIKRIGYPGAVEQPIRYGWDSRTGFQSTRIWIGPYNSCIGLMPQLQANGWNFDMSSANGVNYTLTATIGYSWSGSGIQDNPVDVWEITSTKAEKELLKSNNTSVSTCTKTDIKTLQTYLNAPNGENFLDANGFLMPESQWKGLNDSGVQTALTSSGLVVAGMLVAGIRENTTYQPTIRHTQTVSGSYSIAAAIANVGSIYATPIMLTLIPANLTNAVIADPASPPLNTRYGWLKEYPNVTVSAFNKSQITQDFVFGAYHNILHPNSVTS